MNEFHGLFRDIRFMESYKNETSCLKWIGFCRKSCAKLMNFIFSNKLIKDFTKN